MACALQNTHRFVPSSAGEGGGTFMAETWHIRRSGFTNLGMDQTLVPEHQNSWWMYVHPPKMATRWVTWGFHILGQIPQVHPPQPGFCRKMNLVAQPRGKACRKSLPGISRVGTSDKSLQPYWAVPKTLNHPFLLAGWKGSPLSIAYMHTLYMGMGQNWEHQ